VLSLKTRSRCQKLEGGASCTIKWHQSQKNPQCWQNAWSEEMLGMKKLGEDDAAVH